MPTYQAASFLAFGRNEYLRSTRGNIFEHYTCAASAVALDSAGNKVLQSGTVLATITSASGTSSASDVGKVGPFSPSATDGRQTVANIVGICDSFFPYQLARGDREVAVLKHGRVVGANCYEYDSVGAVTQLAATTTGTAGSTTYRYIVTAVNGVGETVGSNEVTLATGNATLNATNYNNVNWTALNTNGVTGYKIYGTVAGGGAGTETYIGSVTGAAATTFADQGQAHTTATPPATNTTMLAPGTRGLSATTKSALVAGNGLNDLSLLVA